LYNSVSTGVNRRYPAAVARPRSYDDDLRARLIDTASELLAKEGVHALSTRRIAAAVGTSTSAIYSLIGSKPDLLREIFLEGFRRLADHLAATPPTEDPLAHLAALGDAYLDNAIDNPQLYQVMFGPPLPDFQASEDDIAYALSTLQTLIDAVEACVDAGIFRGEPGNLSIELWAAGHGPASLWAAGLLDAERVRAVHRDAMTHLVNGLLADAGRGPLGGAD
jgi:AcrR family transcriptional regulator